MEITSNKNPIIKEIKTLYRKKNRMNLGLFIVEGVKIIEECILNDYPLKYIIYTEELLDIYGGGEIFEKIKDRKPIKVSSKLFKEISDTESPQGILGVASFSPAALEEIDPNSKGIYIYLDGLQDPGNLGTIIRTSDAFKIDGIIIGRDTVDPYNPKVVRATMGSIFRTKLYFLEDIDEILNLRKKGFRILSTNLESSNDIRDIDFRKSIIVIGNESKGVSQEVLSISDEFIKIIMPGNSESLNAAIAASIIMYESSK